MADCELCGRDDSLSVVLVESTKLKVCSSCSKYGNVIDVPVVMVGERPKPKLAVGDEVVVEDYFIIIKKKREDMKMAQKEFASKLNERESTIAKIEQGSFVPTIGLAKKIERILGVRLVAKEKISYDPDIKQKMKPFTLGDFVKKSS